jgi:hypothetical protein
VKNLWSFKYNAPILGIELADIVIVLSLNGELLYQNNISGDTPIWHLKIYDIDNDGKNELIIGGMDGILRIFKCDLAYNLELLWIHKFKASIAGILIDDINNDKINELIVFSLDKTIRILNPLNGNLIWGQIFEDGIGDATIYTNNQRFVKKEIIACGNDGTIRAFNGKDGNLLWFKKFPNKLRCVSYLNSSKGIIILCGGDDKKLYFIDKITKKKIKIMGFKDYIWKCFSYPPHTFMKALISSYSFAFFGNSIPIEKINFTSSLICINEFLGVNWELKGFNIEVLKVIEINNRALILGGTTKGDLIIIEDSTGEILLHKKNNSSINMIQFLIEKSLIICCNDDGTVVAYKLEDIIF